MTMMKTLMGAAATLAVTATGALADPAIIFGPRTGKFDRSFNEAAFPGAEQWAEETGGPTARSNFSRTHSANRRCAVSPKRAANPIVMAGFSQATPLSVVAPDYPDTTSVINRRRGRGAQRALGHLLRARRLLLVGMLAAMTSETDTVSFVGGMGTSR